MRKFLSFLTVFFLSAAIFAENNFFDNYVYQSWTAFGGLSGTTANDIYQTSDGFLNIGTYEGLVKFYGVEFTNGNRSTDKEMGFVSARKVFLNLFLPLTEFHLKEQKIRRENLRLEALVQERTKDLTHEKEKSDKLLRSILPDKVATIFGCWTSDSRKAVKDVVEEYYNLLW